MVEYMKLLDKVDKPEVPLPHKRGMMDVLSRITAYMSNEELETYKRLTEYMQSQVPHA